VYDYFNEEKKQLPCLINFECQDDNQRKDQHDDGPNRQSFGLRFFLIFSLHVGIFSITKSMNLTKAVRARTAAENAVINSITLWLRANAICDSTMAAIEEATL
jgi:hypothetical protein